jgi:2'-5' RNA ligase
VADAHGPPPPATQRLFLALWPDNATRNALERAGEALHRHWGGRRMRADTLHLTLAFLGETPMQTCAVLLPHLAAVRAAPFELRLDRAGCWPHNRIGWLGAAQTPAALIELAADLRGALAAASTTFDRRPFVPHVTLLRQTAGGQPPACAPVRWPVHDFSLVLSRPGARYEILQRWPLREA